MEHKKKDRPLPQHDNDWSRSNATHAINAKASVLCPCTTRQDRHDRRHLPFWAMEKADWLGDSDPLDRCYIS